MGRDPDAGKEGRMRRVWQDEMVGWYHRLNGYYFEQTPGDSEEQGSMACFIPQSRSVGHDLVIEQQRHSGSAIKFTHCHFLIRK